MSADRLDEIKARRAAATPEPWDASASGASMNDRAAYRFGPRSAPPVFLASQMHRADAEFIAHSPDDIDWLVGEVARLRCEWSSSLTREKRWRTDAKAIRAEADDLRRELLAETYRSEGGEVVMRELIAAKAERDHLAAEVRAVEALRRHLDEDSKIYNKINWRNSEIVEMLDRALTSADTPESKGAFDTPGGRAYLRQLLDHHPSPTTAAAVRRTLAEEGTTLEEVAAEFGIDLDEPETEK